MHVTQKVLLLFASFRDAHYTMMAIYSVIRITPGFFNYL